jgi:micrococcal nuclease
MGAVLLLAAAVAILLTQGGDEEGRGGSPGGGDGSERAAIVAVTEVVDGDTIRATVEGENESVRYIGIDTPEVDPSIGVECFGEEASRRNSELVSGQRVRLVPGAEERDRYGRLLAYVYVGERFINAEMVEDGYARTLEIEPNTQEAPLLERLEQGAANAGRGLWGSCPP